MTTLKKIPLGNNGPLVSKLGLGCMRMSSVWGSPVNDESESIATIQMALDSGINFLNTGDFYGSGHNELLVGKAIKGRRDDAFISVKFGAIFYNHQWIGLDLRPIAIKNFINYSLVRLGTDTIDFSEPHKIDLEKFMISNYHFNVPVEKFAQLTGRSLAGFKRDFQKVFDMAPRQWLQEKRLMEARYLIEKKNQKPSAIYLDLGFESLSHFSHSFKRKFGKTPTEWSIQGSVP
jgi:AraC-like DNA-binding protein